MTVDEEYVLTEIANLATFVIEADGKPEHTRASCEQIRQAAVSALGDLRCGPMHAEAESRFERSAA